MRRSFSVSTSSRTTNRWQAYVLLLLGVIFLIGAWLDLLNGYPIGELFFGLGILAASPLNTHRFLPAGWLITLIGLAGFLIFGNMLPISQLLAVHVLAIGMGLLGIRWMARRGYLSTETLTPSLLVVGVGVVEYLQAAHLTPAHFLSFALSLWLPGFGLLVLGLLSLAMSGNTCSPWGYSDTPREKVLPEANCGANMNALLTETAAKHTTKSSIEGSDSVRG